MSKQQALLETLLGAAELTENQSVANAIRANLAKLTRRRDCSSYQHLAAAISEPARFGRKAA
jgi:hypothetical protein